MIEFTFTEEQNMLREMVRDFANNELKPIASKIDEEEEIPDHIIRKVAELGILGAPYPPEYGGSGVGEIGYCIIQEEIASCLLYTSPSPRD